MQRQMEQLQEQMKQVKSELIEAKKKAAEARAAEAKAAEANTDVPAAFKGTYGADLKPFPAKAPSILDRVKLTWGGYLGASTVYRQHNMVSDMGTQFAIIPAHHDKRFACHLSCEKCAVRRHLVCASDRNPVTGKDLFALKALHALIQIPGCGNCISLFQRSILVIQLQQLGHCHACSFSFDAKSTHPNYDTDTGRNALGESIRIVIMTAGTRKTSEFSTHISAPAAIWS